MPSPIAGNNTSPAAETQTKKPSDGSILDKNDFLKLFVAQMQYQDPSKPMDNSQMMAQMASFSSLEQMANMATASQQSNAVSLIGKTVTYKDKLGGTFTGVVDKVTTEGGKAALVVGNQNVQLDQVTQVTTTAPAPAEAEAP